MPEGSILGQALVARRCTHADGGRKIDNPRKYGAAPFAVAVVHGGPGAGGEMAPVARELAADWGVLEPIQTATSVDGQVEELRAVLAEHADGPVSLVGHSWGAWLSTIVAARHPALVARLVLVSSGPFDVSYVDRMRATRRGRLSAAERAEFDACLAVLEGSGAEGEEADAKGKDAALARVGALLSRADDYDPLPAETDEADGAVPVSGDVYQGVWTEAAEMRRSGELLALARRVTCPVIAIHGDYDPHPAEGVRVPLSGAVADFRFVLLERCGHTPWRERWAREPFYRALRAALSEGVGI